MQLSDITAKLPDVAAFLASDEASMHLSKHDKYLVKIPLVDSWYLAVTQQPNLTFDRYSPDGCIYNVDTGEALPFSSFCHILFCGDNSLSDKIAAYKQSVASALEEQARDLFERGIFVVAPIKSKRCNKSFDERYIAGDTLDDIVAEPFVTVKDLTDMTENWRDILVNNVDAGVAYAKQLQSLKYAEQRVVDRVGYVRDYADYLTEPHPYLDILKQINSALDALPDGVKTVSVTITSEGKTASTKVKLDFFRNSIRLGEALPWLFDWDSIRALEKQWVNLHASDTCITDISYRGKSYYSTEAASA